MMTDAEMVRDKPLPPVRTESARFVRFQLDSLTWTICFKCSFDFSGLETIQPVGIRPIHRRATRQSRRAR